MRFAVPVFPGTSGEMDCAKAIREILDRPVDLVWHKEQDLEAYDAILLPGGFSYGDYLRTGALARFSPVMESVKEAAEKGKLILGIGNGFQILLEAGLLPGAMQRNDHLQFRCGIQTLQVVNHQLAFTGLYEAGEEIRLPIAHGEGNYTCDEETLKDLEREGRIVFRYSGENPDGSLAGIAGIVNQRGNVLGLMPHPERAIHEWMGSTDGVRMFQSMLRYWEGMYGAA